MINDRNSSKAWYLPELPVSNPKKDKIRLVFDLSAKYQNTSLNDKLLTGTDLMNRRNIVLLRLRKESIGIAADTEIDSLTVYSNISGRPFTKRGNCNLLHSGRCTNFIGSFNQGAKINTLEEPLKEFKIAWEFNPPKAPQFWRSL